MDSKYFVLDYRKSEAIKGDIMTSNRLVHVLLELYYKWVKKFLEL